MKDKEKTEIILKALEHRQRFYGDVFLPELRLGSGFSDVAQRRIDLFAISSQKGNYTTAYEIKVSRADFLKDIKNDLKQRGARLYSSNFYYVAPKDMIKTEEIPVWAGLMEYDFESRIFRTKVPAPLQSRNTPSWSLICSIVRKVNQQLYTEKILEANNLAEYWKRECNSKIKELKQIANIKDETLLKLILNKYKENEEN